jgi:D-alanyl-D-alanine carboxypeptidase
MRKELTTPKWLHAALDCIPRWLEFQVRESQQPGCAIAVAHRGRLVPEAAFGVADIERGMPLTPRHRFRVASHSKAFTAAGIRSFMRGVLVPFSNVSFCTSIDTKT